MIRSVLLLAALLALGSSAQAADLPTSTLPSLALDPQAPPPSFPSDPAPSIWKGLYVGGGVSVTGAKGQKPFVGGEGFAGYDRHFDNNLVLGIQASTGYAPYLFMNGPFRGFDYAEVTAKAGYEMGRLTPYVLAGVAMAKPTNWSGYSSPSDSLNNVFNGSTNLAASGVVGAGFNYAVTNNLSVGLAAVVGTGHNGLVPPAP